MEMVIVAAVIVVALGAYATFTLADLLPQEVLAKNETHGRFAHLGEETEPAPEPAPLHGRGRERTAVRGGASYRRRGRVCFLFEERSRRTASAAQSGGVT